MASIFTLGVIVRVIDKFTGPLRSFRAMMAGSRQELQKMGQDMQSWGRGALVAGAVMGAALAAPTLAFAQLEDASTSLRVSLMDSKGGLPAAFAAIAAKAVELGNLLPGTTADFFRMAWSLTALGVSAEAVAGGGLEATAKLGVVLRQNGVSYEETARGVATFINALGIAEQDLVPFTDVVQRAISLGVEFTPFFYAIARASSSLKVLGVQGLEAGKDLVPLIAMLHRSGIQGELAGTGLRNVLNEITNFKKLGKANKMLADFGIQLNVLDKSGRFLGIRQMIGELGKLKALDPADLASVMELLFGPGGNDAEVAKLIIMKGMEGYQKIVGEMQGKASLDMKIAALLKTTTNLWETATGNFTNALANFGEVISPELKAAIVQIGDVSAALGEWIKAHPTLMKFVGITALLFTGLITVVGGLAIAIGTVIAVIGGSALATGIIVIAGLAAAVAFLVVYWDKLAAGLRRFGDAQTQSIAAAVAVWNDLVAAVGRFWDRLKGGFGLFDKFAKGWAWLTQRKPMDFDLSGGALDVTGPARTRPPGLPANPAPMISGASMNAAEGGLAPARRAAERLRQPDFADIQGQAADRRRNYTEFLGQMRGQGGARISIGNLNLPNVKSPRDFIGELESLAEGMMPAEASP